MRIRVRVRELCDLLFMVRVLRFTDAEVSTPPAYLSQEPHSTTGNCLMKSTSQLLLAQLLQNLSIACTQLGRSWLHRCVLGDIVDGGTMMWFSSAIGLGLGRKHVATFTFT